jgi:UDP-N-acetylglucosamine acyltransferase
MSNLYDTNNIYLFDKKGNKIHSTAIIEDEVIIGSDNYIGAYTVIKSGTTIGDNNYIGIGCIIGDDPEKVGCFDVVSGVVIGNNNRLSKQVTIDRGNVVKTLLKDNILMLKNAHIGHDCKIMDNCTIGCNVAIGGNTFMEAFVTLGLNASVHQRSWIPMGSMIGANSFWKDNYTDEILPEDDFWIWVGTPTEKTKPNNIGYNRYVEIKENEKR